MNLVYQRIGIYPWAHKNIIPAIEEISRAAGVPGIAMYCYQARGVGKHRTGEACDFQAGNRARYRDSVAVHNRIAKYIIKNWYRLRVRYMAWNGWEYGGSWGGPERKRRQARNYGGSDPWHKNHVHVDFHAGPIPAANAGIAIGAGLVSSTPAPPTSAKPAAPSDSKPDPISLEEDMALIQDGKGHVFSTNGITKRHVPHPSHLKDLERVFGKIQKVSQATADSIPIDRSADIPVIHSDVQKSKAALGRTEPRLRDLITAARTMLETLAVVQTEVHDPESKRTLRERTEQTNEAVGRAEQARRHAEKEESE